MKLIVFSWLTCFCAVLNAQTTFNHRMHFGYPPAVLSGVLSTDSCYFGTGIIADTDAANTIATIFVKFDLDGNPLFVKKLSDPNKWYYTYDPAFIKTNDGNFAVGGISLDSVRKMLLIKYNPDGDTLFTRSYLHPLYPQESFVYLHDLKQSDDGGFVMVGNLELPSGINNTDILFIKTDSLGTEIFSKTFGVSNRDDLGASILSVNDGFIIGGLRDNTNIATENYIFQLLIFYINTSGDLISQYITPDNIGLKDAANNMVLLNDGGLVVASGRGYEIERTSVNDIHFDKQIFKLNPNQEIEWELTFPDKELTSWSRTSNLINLSDGSGYILTGMEYTKIGFPPVLFTVKGWVGKISPEGDSVWTRRYAYLTDRPNAHEIFDAKETPDGGIILCGESRDYSDDAEFPQQAWLLKLDEYGCLIPGCQVVGDAEEEVEGVFKLAIFPNPTSDYLNFQLRNAPPQLNGLFRIVDVQGRLVRSFDVGNMDDTYIVPVWDWPGGIYFLQLLKDGVVVASERFVVGR